MTRPSFHDIYSQMALLMAKRSTCRRLSVGAVITSADFRYVYGLGYNGNAAGLANACDSAEPGKCGCLHAEVNAVINCTVARDVPKIVFCTDLPCVNCAKVLINLGGVKQIYYGRDYRIRDSLELFKQVGIPIEMLPTTSKDTAAEIEASAKGQGPRADYAPCGVCVITREGFKSIYACPEHGKGRPGQGAVDPFEEKALLKAWLTDPEAPAAELRPDECKACWALRETGGNDRFLHLSDCHAKTSGCPCGRRLVPSCSIHGGKIRAWAVIKKFTGEAKHRFAYTRDAQGIIRGCVAAPNGDGFITAKCPVCKGDCPDKERFAKPPNLPSNIGQCQSCGRWWFDTMLRMCGFCGSRGEKVPHPLAAKPERSNLEIAQDGVRAIMAQDERAAVAAVDRANNEAVQRDPQLAAWLSKVRRWDGPGVYDHHGGGVYTALFLATYRHELPPQAVVLLEVKHHDTRATMIVATAGGEGGDDFMLHYPGWVASPEATTFVIYVSHLFGSVMARPLSWAGDDAWNDIVTWEEPYKHPIKKPRFVRRPDKEQPK